MSSFWVTEPVQIFILNYLPEHFQAYGEHFLFDFRIFTFELEEGFEELKHFDI